MRPKKAQLGGSDTARFTWSSVTGGSPSRAEAVDDQARLTLRRRRSASSRRDEACGVNILESKVRPSRPQLRLGGRLETWMLGGSSEVNLSLW